MSLGALTTQFTPAPSCLAPSNLWIIRTTSTSIHEYNFFGRPLDAAQGCFPPGYNPASISYYSPAICPSGYTAASGTSRVITGSVTETTEVCCPTASLFRPQTQDNTNTQHPFLTTLLCEYIIPTPFGATVTSTATGQAGSKVTSATMGNAINAYAVLVRRNNFDLTSNTASPTATPSNSENTSSSSTRSSNSGATSGEGDAQGNAKEKSGTLGTGASIGIGVGLGVVVLGLLMAIVFLVLRRRKRNKDIAAAAMLSANAHKGISPTSTVQYRHEVASPSHEMDGTAMRVEKAVSDRPPELDGSYSGRYPPPAELPGTYKGAF
ncbi:hypothetical protein DM02DRAFT_666954 [Periconia macrospinosa]|uniref:Mid2 domain-containing protein n=1 Tax=Periconia macrospinosa TaxID=97972 RepID=A0A2V1E9C7_9PLEO|nr:hypothetical protein DM02DRAFT_666954 [Periconia macrospinosa]